MGSERLVIGPSRRKAVRLLLLTGPFVVVGVLMVLFPEDGGDRAAGLAGVAFFGAGAALALASMVRQRTPRVTLDDECIEIHQGLEHLIVPWDWIVEVGQLSMFRNRMVTLTVSDPRLLSPQRGWLQRAISRWRRWGDVAIVDSWLSTSSTELRAEILRRWTPPEAALEAPAEA